MASQIDIFGGGGERPERPPLPESFRYEPELIGCAEEAALLKHVRKVPFRDFEFHGYVGKRRAVSCGWQYDFAARELRRVNDMP